MAENHAKWWQPAVAFAVVAVTVFSMLGLQGAVSALQGRVAELEVIAEEIEDTQAQIEVLHREVQEVARFRDDILAAICAANARRPIDVRRCDNGVR